MWKRRSTASTAFCSPAATMSPTRYGGRRSAGQSVEAEPGRDEFRLKLVAGARARNLPILPSARRAAAEAWRGERSCRTSLAGDRRVVTDLGVPPHEPYPSRTKCGSTRHAAVKLMGERLSDTDACDVNSRHHQAVKETAPGLVVSATVPDGVIEAIEDPQPVSASACNGTPRISGGRARFRPLFEGFLKPPSAQDKACMSVRLSPDSHLAHLLPLCFHAHRQSGPSEVVRLHRSLSIFPDVLHRVAARVVHKRPSGRYRSVSNCARCD